MKFRNDATRSPPQSPGIEKNSDWNEISVTRLLCLKPSALNIPY